MLALLRKYQKAIFAVVAFMVIASFSFFGTYGAVKSDLPKEEDVSLGKVLGGGNLSSKTLHQVERFLDTDFFDVMAGLGGSANLLNDGFLRNDLVKSGLASILFNSSKEEIWSELKDKVQKFKEFKPYVHPSKFVSFEMMISQFARNYHEDLDSFRKATLDEENFQYLGKLYVDQTIFPAEMMRKMMLYVEHQYSSMAKPDPSLKQADLSLFYAKRASDWFGFKFLDKASRFVVHGAAFAEKKGYKVSKEEAKAHILQTLTKHLHQLDQNADYSEMDVTKYYRQEMAKLQMGEKDLLNVCQKILVLRKMLDEIGHSVFVDANMYQQFAKFASEGALVEVYSLPKDFQFKKEEDLIKFEIYLDAVSQNRDDSLLPTHFRPMDEINLKAPELLEKRFLVNIAHMKKSDLLSEVSLRKTWDWQLDDQNWQELKDTFSELKAIDAQEKEVRFSILQNLAEEIREKIDQYARKKILDAKTDLVKEKLTKAQLEKKLLTLSLKGEDETLSGIKDKRELLDLLESQNEKLSCFSQDEENFYRIEILDKSSLWEILTFKEANERGVLASLLEKKLLNDYKKKGFSAPFSEVRDQLIDFEFSALRKKYKEIELSKDESVEVALQRRFFPYMKKMQNVLVSGVNENILTSDVMSKSECLTPKDGLDKQWLLKKESIKVSRKMAHPYLDENLYKMAKGQWSSILSTSEGPVFYQVLDKYEDLSDVNKKMEEGRELLGKEAKEEFVSRLLADVKALEDGVKVGS
jgi:GcvH upstream region-like protein